MTKRRVFWLVAIAPSTAALAMTMAGCELVVDFDRTKLSSDAGQTATDGSVADSSTPRPDASTDGSTGSDAAGNTDSGATDAASDAGADATPDGSALTDAAADADAG